jgi:hypothetical protein
MYRKKEWCVDHHGDLIEVGGQGTQGANENLSPCKVRIERARAGLCKKGVWRCRVLRVMRCCTVDCLRAAHDHREFRDYIQGTRVIRSIDDDGSPRRREDKFDLLARDVRNIVQARDVCSDGRLKKKGSGLVGHCNIYRETILKFCLNILDPYDFGS